MRYLLLWFFLIYSAARAETETLYPDSVSTPDQWSNVGGAGKVASVTDDVDDNLIDETTQGQKQRFTLQNSSEIGQNDIIDSVTVYSRMKTPSGSGVVTRVNHIVTSTANGSSRSLTGTWTDYYDTYGGNPEGGNWSLSDINNLKIEAEAVAIPVLKRANCTKMYVTVYYTPYAPPARRKIIQQLMLMGD